MTADREEWKKKTYCTDPHTEWDKDQNNKLTSGIQKLIYQKDLSEHCRRRVIPSIFLGRQVVDANAQILQFSRLELPYSCFISIRTESGSNMVMVILMSPSEVEQACNRDSKQLLVYEMGETFGGYWGPLPNSVMKRETLPPKVYTLKTTQPEETIPSSTIEEEETETTEQTSLSSQNSTKISSADYIEVEVPLLNVSIHFVPGSEHGRTEPLDLGESFDWIDDVAPIPGVAYDRKILPLVQFQLHQQPGGQRRSEDEPPKYELDIVQEFTPDLRLTMPPFNFISTKRHYKQRYQVTRHLNFKKHRALFNSQRQRHNDRRMPETITRRMNDVTKYTFPTKKTTITKDKTEDSWQAIRDLMKRLDKIKENNEVAGKSTLSVNETVILENMSNMNHNFSVYLNPNHSKISNQDSKYISRINDKLSTRKSTSLAIKITKQTFNVENPRTEDEKTMIPAFITEDNKETIENVESETKTLSPKERKTIQNNPLTLASETISTSENPTINLSSFENTSVSETEGYLETVVYTNQKKEDPVGSKNNKKTVTGSLVGHESWENVVQAAPEMAELLNQTLIVVEDVTLGHKSDDMANEFNETFHKNKPSERKKREIHSIAINNARPNSMTTRRPLITTTHSSYEVADMQEFAQLVELQDDEMHGRVALRHLRQYLGPALFNLCDIEETTKRHVHLFNSSRIVLAITNFTLEKMVIILTAARTLLTGETRCPKSQLECQVAGARVCLDSMVACDSVPNCGSYDIYDEDRLLCGSSVALRYNVYLAAFTFLAVLLTLLYAIHYWLKQCVPKVADAFFVYTDGVENILYLDSIMRSPHDTNDEDSKMIFHSHLHGYDNIYDVTTATPLNVCQRFLRKLCCCFPQKENETDEIKDIDIFRSDQRLSKRMYSFTELEIRKMFLSSKEAAVQTGDSLDMKVLENKISSSTSRTKPEVRPATASYDFSIKTQNSLLTLEEPLPEERKDELSLIQLCKAARLDSVGSVSNNSISVVKARDSIIQSCEKEISTHTYDHIVQVQPGPSKRKKKGEKKIAPSASVSKHLRFDEVTTTIVSEDYDGGDDVGSSSFDRRRCVTLGESSWRGSKYLDTIEEADEHFGKEQRNFWGTLKKKKSKKKMFFNTK